MRKIKLDLVMFSDRNINLDKYHFKRNHVRLLP